MQRLTLRLIVAVLMAGLLTSRAGAGMIFVSGEISNGTGKLVISDDMVFDMTTNSDPFMMTLEWETGLGTARWPNLSSDSDLVATTGGTLEIDANIPWSDEPFVHNVGSTNDRRILLAAVHSCWEPEQRLASTLAIPFSESGRCTKVLATK